jgi:hypothetical protein
MPATHSTFGSKAQKWSSTRSDGRGRDGRSVAAAPHPAGQGRLRIQALHRQGATAMSYRLSWRHTLRAPYAP